MLRFRSSLESTKFLPSLRGTASLRGTVLRTSGSHRLVGFLWKWILRLVSFWAVPNGPPTSLGRLYETRLILSGFWIDLMAPRLPLEVDFETRLILGGFWIDLMAPQLPLEVDFETRLILGGFWIDQGFPKESLGIPRGNTQIATRNANTKVRPHMFGVRGNAVIFSYTFVLVGSACGSRRWNNGIRNHKNGCQNKERGRT